MAQEAFVTQYRNETIATFEQRYSDLRMACVQEAVIKGNTAVFLIAGSGGASAVTRGINGQIAFGVVDNTQLSCTLTEKHAPFETTDFNIFASQGNQKAIMQQASIGTLNRDIDDVIIAQLDTATQDTATAVEATQDLVEMCITILGNADVPVEEEDKMFGIISPAFRSMLRQNTTYASGEYVDAKPLQGPVRKMWRWAGINWVVSGRITGKGTSSEKCYILHQNALGHAANMKDMEVDVGYEKKQKNSWTNASLYHGGKLLQNTGVVQALHDGSRYVAA
jgi:hypothetical protein